MKSDNQNEISGAFFPLYRTFFNVWKISKKWKKFSRISTYYFAEFYVIHSHSVKRQNKIKFPCSDNGPIYNMNIVVEALESCAFNLFFKRLQRQWIKQPHNDECMNSFIMMVKQTRTSLHLKPFFYTYEHKHSWIFVGFKFRN